MTTEARLTQLERDMAELEAIIKTTAEDLSKRGVTLNIPTVESGTIGGTQ